MSMEVGLWRLADDGPARVAVAKLPAEDELEELVMRDPSVLGEPLLIIGRQVHTAHGGRIDLLGLDEAARLHVLELKRDQTPRDVVAQTLDYTSWASALGHADLTDIYSHFSVKYQLPDTALEAAFEDAFGAPLPDQVNASPSDDGHGVVTGQRHRTHRALPRRDLRRRDQHGVFPVL